MRKKLKNTPRNTPIDHVIYYYKDTTTVLRVVYSTADCMSLQLGTVTTVTTGFVGKSHGLLMHLRFKFGHNILKYTKAL